MNIKALVFSKDRAMQLDGTLRSFYLHCKDPELTNLNVLYRTSTPELEHQYQIIKAEYPQVNFIKEGNFREDMEKLLLPFYENKIQSFFYRSLSTMNRTRFTGHPTVQKVLRHLSKLGVPIGRVPVPAPKGEKYICFMVDDNLFVRPFSLRAVVQALHAIPHAIGFSLRLGKNTSCSYTLNSKQELPEFEDIDDGIMAYDWPLAKQDFNYPLEISSSIYRAAQVMPLMASIAFRNPNSLEGEMAARSRWLATRFPKLLCFNTSVAFCNPVNKVQTIEAGNRAGLIHHYTVEELSERFDKGERIDVISYSWFCPNSCHQEVELRFKSQK